MTKRPNLRGVRALIGDARPVEARQRLDPEVGQPRNGVEPGDWTADLFGLPPDCPVVPLGVSGNVFWFLDTIGQLQPFGAPYGRGNILPLFMGRHEYLYWAWPKRVERTRSIEGWRPEKVAECLTAACSLKGPWNATEKVRGRGAWRDRHGGLILHTGRFVYMPPLPGAGQGRAPPSMAPAGPSAAKLQPQPPGDIAGYVYPTRPEIPGPWPEPIEGAENLAKLLLQLLESWQWARPEVDPLLLIGWIGASYIGGALDWRPAVFITGDTATGKSTLQELVKLLLGDALVQAVNTTAAGIYQRLGHDSLPVAVDELEATADPRKQKSVLELARQAASGGLMLRGGDRHEGVEFQARSCFLFSSINAPPLEPQDLNRMALLRLNPLPMGQAEPAFPDLEVIGRMILRRMLDGWGRLPATLAAYKAELAAAGMGGRGQDTFGTLLACADLVLHDGWHEDRLKIPVDGDMVPLRDVLRPSVMPEFEDAIPNWRACLNHLLTAPVEAWRAGGKPSVGRLLEDFYRTNELNDFVKVKHELSFAGLGLHKIGHGGARACWLVVPNSDPRLGALFAGTKWGGQGGHGVWGLAVKQAPPDTLWRPKQTSVNGAKGRMTLISLEGLYGENGIMRDTEGEQSNSADTPGPDLL